MIFRFVVYCYFFCALLCLYLCSPIFAPYLYRRLFRFFAFIAEESSVFFWPFWLEAAFFGLKRLFLGLKFRFFFVTLPLKAAQKYRPLQSKV